MSTFPILVFEPQFKDVIWGGKRIAQFKGLPAQGDHIGESWEISGVPGHESVVADGIYKGRNMLELLREFSREIMGDRLSQRYGLEFPLLIKFIDSADDLSVQVHPDDKLAAERHNCPGKTEMWISVAPEDGAYLYAGLTRAITPDEYRSRIADNTILECLGKFDTHKNEVFFLPAGRVHSIGRGNLILEIQETSDITYRIYDFDRRDANGNPRQLHVEESIAAVDFNDTENAAPTVIPDGKNEQFTLVDCYHFTATSVDVENQFRLELSARDSFSIIIAIEGDAVLIDADGRQTSLPKGFSALIPASMPEVTVKGNCKVVTTYIK